MKKIIKSKRIERHVFSDKSNGRQGFVRRYVYGGKHEVLQPSGQLQEGSILRLSYNIPQPGIYRFDSAKQYGEGTTVNYEVFTFDNDNNLEGVQFFHLGECFLYDTETSLPSQTCRQETIAATFSRGKPSERDTAAKIILDAIKILVERHPEPNDRAYISHHFSVIKLGEAPFWIDFHSQNGIEKLADEVLLKMTEAESPVIW